MLVRKLELDRDFTRFLNDPTFPFKVTACIGEERILCSGVLLAQQSSLLEQKFREDGGVLMFEEMLDVDGGSEGLNKCIRFLHGADVDLSIEDFAVCVKFASCYNVKDLFEYCLQWLREYFKSFDSTKSVGDVLSFLKLSHSLYLDDSEKLRSKVICFIRAFRAIFFSCVIDFIDIDVLGVDMITIIKENLMCNNAEILRKWASLSIHNRYFIINNHDRFDLVRMFPNEEETTSFISLLSEGTANSTESCKALLDLQKKFFKFQLSKISAANSNCSQCYTSEGSEWTLKTASSTVSGTTTPSAKSELLAQDSHPVSLSDDKPKLSRTVSVLNLPPGISKKRLEQMFQFIGKLRYVKISAPDSRALMTFEDVSTTHDLLIHNFEQGPFLMENCALMVTPIFYQHAFNFQNNQVAIWNIPATISKTKLKRLFSFAGRIKSIEIFPQNFHAVITFHTVDSTKSVYEQNSLKTFFLDDMPLLINDPNL